MFSKLFNLSKAHDSKISDPLSKDNISDIKHDSFQTAIRSPNLSEDGIRILIYKESERRSDKTLLFDSDAVIHLSYQNGKVSKNSETKSANATSTPTKPHSYKYTKPNHDVKMLGEMIMGSVAMVFKGDIVKVHLIRFPPQLMITKVFALKPRSIGLSVRDNEISNKNDIFNRSNQADTISLNEELIPRTHSNPLEMMKNSSMRRSCSSVNSLYFPTALNSTFDDSWSMSGSIVSLDSVSPACSPCSSVKQRYIKNRNQSLDSPFYLRSKTEISEEMRSIYKHQPRIGIGVIFKLWDKQEYNRDFQKFFFTHFTIIEAHLQRLQMTVEKSFYLKQHFIDIAVTAVNNFKEDVLHLYHIPRMKKPLWLSLPRVIDKNQNSSAIESWMKSFLRLAESCETKERNYFLSTLLTSLLTYHLSWSSAVFPSNLLSKGKAKKSVSNTSWPCHVQQYNAQWAQLSDMHGCLSNPVCFSRTVVAGKKKSIVYEMLNFLSYFLRCFNIQETKVAFFKSRKTMSNIVKTQRQFSITNEQDEKISSAKDKSMLCKPTNDKSLCTCSLLKYMPICTLTNDKKGHSLVACKIRDFNYSEKLKLLLNQSHCSNGTNLKDVYDLLFIIKHDKCQLDDLSNILPPRMNLDHENENSRAIKNVNSIGLSEPSFVCYCCEKSSEKLNTEKINGYKDSCFCFDFEISKSTIMDIQDALNTQICCYESEAIHSVLTMDLKTLNLKFFPFPKFDLDCSTSRPGNKKLEQIGQSLFAGYTKEVQADFALQGVQELDKNKMAKLLQNSTRCPVLDEPFSHAVSVLADTDTWNCEILRLSKRTDETNNSSSEYLESEQIYPSSFVSELIESTCELYKFGLSPEFCLLHIEQQLRDALNLAKVCFHIGEVNGDISATTFLQQTGFHESDRDFIKSIVSTFR